MSVCQKSKEPAKLTTQPWSKGGVECPSQESAYKFSADHSFSFKAIHIGQRIYHEPEFLSSRTLYPAGTEKDFKKYNIKMSALKEMCRNCDGYS